MRQLVQSMRTGVASVLDVPPPRLSGPGVLVHTAASLVSSGTERATTQFARSSLAAKARSRPDLVKQVLEKVRRDGLTQAVSAALARLDRPLAPGYATSGTVMAVAPGVDDVNVGDRVACAGASYATHAEINYVPKNLIVPVPRRANGEYVSFNEAAFTTLGAIALHGVRLGAPELGQRVVVIGLGVIGLLATQILRAHGCRVFGVDPSAGRCNLARSLGADDAMGPDAAGPAVLRWSGGMGADLVVVAAATSDSEPATFAADVARDRGRVVAIGETRLDVPRRLLYRKELSLVVSRSYGPGRYDPAYEELGRDYPRAYVRWTERENMRAFIQLLADRGVEVEPLISHRFGIEQGAEAYDTLERGDALGILLEYGRTETGRAVAPTLVPLSPRARPQGQVGISAIGAGAFARTVLLPLLPRGAVDRRQVVTSTGLSARSAADKFGFSSCSTSVQDVWRDGDCDAVVIATRHDSHARLTIEALEAGKAVFLEKPLCVTEEELDRLIGVAESSSDAGHTPFVMVGFNRRFSPAVEAVRQAMTGPVSILYRVNAGHLAPDSWAGRPEEGGGRIVGEVCHFVDLCAHLAGSPITQVSATRSTTASDDVMVSLRMANGSIATVAYLCDGDRGVSKERIEVFGGSRTAIIDDFRRARVSGVGRTVRYGGPLARRDKGHAGELAAFVSAVASGAPSPVSWASVINSTRATFAIVRSLESGGSVLLP